MKQPMIIKTCEIRGCNVKFETKEGHYCRKHLLELKRESMLRSRARMNNTKATPEEIKWFLKWVTKNHKEIKLTAGKQIITGMCGV